MISHFTSYENVNLYLPNFPKYSVIQFVCIETHTYKMSTYINISKITFIHTAQKHVFCVFTGV